jgi:Holliday junction resolvase-like predicted endonuclease
MAQPDHYPVRNVDIAEVIEDIRQFFLDPNHWVYRSRGTPSDIAPTSVFHVGQLEVLFEDKHFHFRTNAALLRLRTEGFLVSEDVPYDGGVATLVWRPRVRYTRRLISDHIKLMNEYSSESMNKATGAYAETLTLLGLSRLGLKLLSRNTRSFGGQVWTQSDHNLDFILEGGGRTFGVEVKNTWAYFPTDELVTKLRICEHLRITPLFVARHRHSGQWDAVRDAGGMLYIFKSKLFPPGQEEMTRRIWRQMRLPVTVWNDWPVAFYNTIEPFLGQLS